MHKSNKNVALLSACQALLFTNNSTVIALNGLAGYALARNKAYATIPVSAWVLGAAATSFLASMLMKRVGRRAGFSIGTMVGIAGALLAAIAIWVGSFALLSVATFVFGTYNAFGQLYRFAAADASPPDFKSKAISLVLAGGLVGGFLGPLYSWIALDQMKLGFAAAYLGLMIFMIIAILVQRALDLPMLTEAEMREPGRPLPQIMAEPKFVVAVLAASLGYGVMNLLMTATPLEMTTVCGHSYGAAVFVIGSHVVGMFAPSLFTGSVIKRYGVMNVMLVGTILLFVTVGIALSGITVAHFWLALVLLGVGWNFLYIGGTSLLTEVYRSAERNKVQGTNDSIVFVVMMMTSFGSGFLLDKNGWAMLNCVSAAGATLILVALLWGTARTRVGPRG